MRESNKLSKTETKILTALIFEMSQKEMAAHFNLSLHTIKKHLQNAYRKLHVKKGKDAMAILLKGKSTAEKSEYVGSGMLEI